MKIIYFLLFAILAKTFASKNDLNDIKLENNKFGLKFTNFGFSDTIREALENLKEQLRCGFPEKEIPPLAPFEREYHEFDIKEDFLTLFASIANLRIDGADNYNIGICDFSLITWKFKLNLNFNKIHISRGKYLLKTLIAEEIAGLEFHGDGDIDFGLENLSANIDLQLGLGWKGLYLKKFNIILNIENCKSNITGLTGGGLPSKIINVIVEKILVDVVREHQRQISNKLNDIIVPIADEILYGITLKDILGWITGWSKTKSTCNKY